MIAEKLFADHNFEFKDGLFFHNQFSNNEFEHVYIDIRQKEGRLFPNSEVIKLPEVDRGHPLFKEWQIRKRSAQRLAEYVRQKSGEKKVLEIGCGNGWLSHQLSKIKDTHIIGLDVNVTELKQAAEVFQGIPNLTFIAGDIFKLNLPVKLNYVILASSVQYFPDLAKLVSQLSNMLSDHGEIHILDSPFYDFDNVTQAKGRSITYFDSQDSKMIDYYHHHTWMSLAKFKFEVLYNPRSVLTTLKNKFRVDSPFPWIKIKKAPNGK